MTDELRMHHRRTFLKTSAFAGAWVASPFFISKGLARSGDASADGLLGHGSFRYRPDVNWGALDPIKTPVFNCHEMVMDSQKRLVMLTDEIKNNIIIYDKGGKLIDSWGTRWPGGHGLTLSQEGDEDFLFIVDCGWYFGFGRDEKWHRQSGTVTKTTLDGRVIFTLGHPQTVGAYEEGQTFMPTETAVAPNGDIYVADGYGSNYILQYNHKGEYIRKFGGTENTDTRLNLQNAHGVAVDQRDPSNPVLICTSRSENCFKRFTLEGQYLDTIPVPGAFVCRPVLAGENLYAGVCWSKQNGTGKRNEGSGFVTILDRNNKVVSNPGGCEPQYKNGKLQAIYQTSKLFTHGHDVCVDDDENAYVCQWNAKRTYPIKLERV